VGQFYDFVISARRLPGCCSPGLVFHGFSFSDGVVAVNQPMSPELPTKLDAYNNFSVREAHQNKNFSFVIPGYKGLYNFHLRR
jgi:hypothetical protein